MNQKAEPTEPTEPTEPSILKLPRPKIAFMILRNVYLIKYNVFLIDIVNYLGDVIRFIYSIVERNHKKIISSPLYIQREEVEKWYSKTDETDET